MKFKINGKEYNGAKFDYNAYCSLSEMGIPVDKLLTDPFVGVRGYLALSGNMSVQEAGNELEQHIINDGDLSDISKVFADEIKASGFFQKLLSKMTDAVEKMETKPKTTRRKK